MVDRVRRLPDRSMDYDLAPQQISRGGARDPPKSAPIDLANANGGRSSATPRVFSTRAARRSAGARVERRC